jgi:hypothetical protein
LPGLRLNEPQRSARWHFARFPTARTAAARQLAAFVRSHETQAWIETIGRGQLDEQPLFFPLADRSR